MTDITQSEDQPSLPWRRFVLFGLLFVVLTAIGLYIVYDQFADRNLSFDPRLLEPGLLASVAGLLLVYYTADGLRLYYTLSALGHRLADTSEADNRERVLGQFHGFLHQIVPDDNISAHDEPLCLCVR